MMNQELSAEELKQREQLIVKQYGGILPQNEVFYLNGIISSAKSAIDAFERLKMLIETEHHNGAVLAIYEALTHSAALSRYFWPPHNKKSDVPRHRGEKLRKAFHLDDTSALKDRNLRNSLEHFDERLDVNLLQSSAGWVVPGPLVQSHTIVDVAGMSIFKLLDPTSELFVVFGNKHYYGPVRDEVERILRTATAAFDSNGRLPRPAPS